MATFKVGQRVRVVNPEPMWPRLRGMEAVINRIGPGPRDSGRAPYEYGAVVQFAIGSVAYNFYAWELAPLTDPDSEWADEAVKQLIRKATTDKLPLAAEMLAEIRGGA
jgi:hypothetical protein